MKETVDATKQRFDRDAALALARTAKSIVAGRGKNLIELDPAEASDDELAKLLLGPSGNLKAPTARVGSRLLVGFNEIVYRKYLA